MGVTEDSRGLASIIIPCAGGARFVQLAIEAVITRTDRPWELILVDDRSDAETMALLRRIAAALPRRVRILDGPAPAGCPAARNRGLRAARGAYLVLLDSDVVVTDGWLESLVRLAESAPEVGLVGPVSNFAPPPQGLDAVPYADLEGLHPFAARRRTEHRGRWSEVGTLFGSCLLMKRRVYQDVGGVDERFGPGYFDDVDLGRRARAIGYRMLLAHDAFVHHFGGRTVAARGLDLENLLRTNRARLVAKWRARPPVEALAPGEAPGRPRISLTMIVRDAEDDLPACLESARDLFDDLIIVDTGSTDRTAEVARRLGARVFDFPGVEDRAAARNAALARARARGGYAFWLDACERIAPTGHARLRDLLNGLRGDGLAFEPTPASDPGATAGPAESVRLFPVRADVHWSGRARERLQPALRAAGIEVRAAAIAIRRAREGPGRRAACSEWERRLLLEEARDRPHDPYTLLGLAELALERADGGGALDLLPRCLAGLRPHDPLARRARALAAQARLLASGEGADLIDAALAAWEG